MTSEERKICAALVNQERARKFLLNGERERNVFDERAKALQFVIDFLPKYCEKHKYQKAYSMVFDVRLASN